MIEGGTQIKKGSKINFDLEALRGFAALIVVFRHVAVYKQLLDPNFYPRYLINFFSLAHFAVLVFFVLSGYVIGVSNKKAFKRSDIVPYLKKRAIRLIPIYVISIFFALAIATHHYSTHTIISNLLFGQGIFSKAIWEINPVWSLSCEVVYYLLFIPISFFRINPFFVLIATIVAAFCSLLLLESELLFVSAYLFGFAFWVSGLCIARYSSENLQRSKYAVLLSGFFYMLCIEEFIRRSFLFPLLVSFLFNKDVSHINSISKGNLLQFRDLAVLPYAVILVMIFSSKKILFKRQILLLLQVPVLYVIARAVLDQKFNVTFIVSLGYYFISLMIYLIRSNYVEKFSKAIVNAGIWLGGISYGIYIIHFPILVVFGKLQLLSGSIYSFLVRLVLYFTVVITASYFLEKRYQPSIKKLLTGPKTL